MALRDFVGLVFFLLSKTNAMNRSERGLVKAYKMEQTMKINQQKLLWAVIILFT